MTLMTMPIMHDDDRRATGQIVRAVPYITYEQYLTYYHKVHNGVDTRHFDSTSKNDVGSQSQSMQILFACDLAYDLVPRVPVRIYRHGTVALRDVNMTIQ